MTSSSSSYYSPSRLYNSTFSSAKYNDIVQRPTTSTVCSLQCLSAKILLQQCNSMPKRLENVLETYKTALFIQFLALPSDDAVACGLSLTLATSQKTLQDQFPALLQKFGKEYLSNVLGSDILEHLIDTYNKQLSIKSRMASYRTGVIIQPEKVDYIEPSPEGYYPLIALIQGVEWPANVDPSRREDYLNPQEFEDVFGMARERFNSLPKFHRVRLKKEYRLF